MTLRDIAVLARVQRPVVTMWRSRPHLAAGSFPPPVAQVDGRDRFARADVVAWLAASGRGNNPEVAQDAPMYTRPPVPTPAGAALTQALLVVAAVTDEPLASLDREDLLDRTDEVDPDDRMAWAEIATASPSDLAACAAYVDGLVGASRGPQEALAHLRRDPSRFAMTPDDGAPAQAVVQLAGALAQALADCQRLLGPVPVADPTGCSADLVLGALAARPAADREGVLIRPVTPTDSPQRAEVTRESWRVLALHDASPAPIAVDEEGHIDIPGAAVIVGRYPHPGASAARPLRVLEDIDDMLVQLKDDQRAVVLGPAAILTDALRGRVALRRRRILDTGRLRALVRLSPGSTPAAPQRRLALWVFGPTPVAGNFRGEGRTVVADLAGLDLARIGDDLITDVVAAVEDRPQPGADDSQGRAHVFAVARYQRTFQVLARDGDLVPRDLRAAPRRATGDSAQAVAAARAVARPLAGVGVEVGARAEPIGAAVTVRALLDGGRLRLLPGTRLLDEEILTPDQAVAALTVVGVPELCDGMWPGRRVVDHLAFTAAHPRAARTEAGDVVFCTGAQAAAWVDPRGGTVVQAPARCLRVQPQDGHADRVLPRILASDLARGREGQWRAISTRLVPATDAASLAPALDALAAAREETLRRLDDLDLLTEAMTLGAVETRLTDMMNPIDQEGH